MNNLDTTITYWLDDAIDLNIIVFDHEKRGVLTRRLLCLLKSYYYKTFKEKPKEFWVSESTYCTLDVFSPKRKEIVECTKAYGIPIIKYHDDIVQEWIDYFFAQGCSLFDQDKNIIVAAGNYHMLGCL